MNFKKLAALFSKKTTAQEQETTVEQTASPQENNEPQDQPCTVYEMGTLEYPAFIPQPLLSFYLIQKVYNSGSTARGDISMVKVISLFHPQTSAFIGTVFAIKDEKGWYWAKVGSRTVFFSKPEAFIYKPAEKFRIRLKQKDSKIYYVAVCEYKQEQVLVTAILKEMLVPPTDDDREYFVRCEKLPCSLEEATTFVSTL